MDLNGIAAVCTRAVTPSTPVTLYLSTGYTTAADGTQTPVYDVRTRVTADVQSLTGGDLRQLDGLNLQTANCAAYLHGDIEGIKRVEGVGGDLLTIAAGVNKGTWLVVTVLETWADWCKVALVMQTEAPA
jgi:hypothetical protein